MSSEQDYADQIEGFVRETFAVAADDPHFGRDRDLFDAGYVDSIGLVELLAWIEERWGIEVPDGVLVSDEFTTVDGMARVLARLSTSDD
jgi:acyl carrier protein